MIFDLIVIAPNVNQVSILNHRMYQTVFFLDLK